jgi:hypothetical protein
MYTICMDQYISSHRLPLWCFLECRDIKFYLIVVLKALKIKHFAMKKQALYQEFEYPS